MTIKQNSFKPPALEKEEIKMFLFVQRIIILWWFLLLLILFVPSMHKDRKENLRCGFWVGEQKRSDWMMKREKFMGVGTLEQSNFLRFNCVRGFYELTSKESFERLLSVVHPLTIQTSCFGCKKSSRWYFCASVKRNSSCLL